jgi:predicted Zn-ribbon and HTH transcriptional regulator
MSRRSRIIDFLGGQERPTTAREISIALGIPEATVSRDLRHIARSVRSRSQILLTRPAECPGCGFIFNTSAGTPSKCPSCRSTRILPPNFLLQDGEESREG